LEAALKLSEKSSESDIDATGTSRVLTSEVNHQESETDQPKNVPQSIQTFDVPVEVHSHELKPLPSTRKNISPNHNIKTLSGQTNAKKRKAIVIDSSSDEDDFDTIVTEKKKKNVVKSSEKIGDKKILSPKETKKNCSSEIEILKPVVVLSKNVNSKIEPSVSQDKTNSNQNSELKILKAANTEVIDLKSRDENPPVNVRSRRPTKKISFKAGLYLYCLYIL